MTPLNGFLEVGMYGDSAGLRLRGRCGRRGACVRTARCVRADGRMHGAKSAGKCVWESQEMPETAENKRKSPLRWNECSGLRGADGSRNRDLFDANEALYQLSYSPLDVTLLRKATRNNIVRSAVKRNLTPKCRTRVDTVTFRCRRRGKSPTPLRMDTAAAPGNAITSPARPTPSSRCRTRTRCRPSRTARPRTRRRCGSPRRTPCRWWRRR